MKYLHYWFPLLLLLVLASCRQQQSDKVLDGSPEITFEETDFTFLEIFEGETRDFEYKFTNTGTSTLMILDVQVACGCTLSSWNHSPIDPGETGVLKVHFDSSRLRGLKHNFIDVFTNGNHVRLFFTAEVI
ncbi:MAG: DUF1573 domain-containing protein [Bacteroidales bacterium]|nr:DUF1573 domain-containing protein [Bacteroidales bacterium]